MIPARRLSLHSEEKPAMQGNQDVIDAMNAGLTIELTAINLYFIHAKMCKNWGYNDLATHFYEESIEEMKHAEYLIDRILFLDGTPEIARYGVIKVGKTVQEQLQNALELELNAVSTYNGGITLAGQKNDAASREIMERILRESEDSVDWTETQLSLIGQIGYELYLSTKLGEDEGEG